MAAKRTHGGGDEEVARTMMRAGILERRGARLVIALAAVLVLAVAAIVVSGPPAKALPCDPTRQDCPPGGGSSTIRATLSVSTNNPNVGKVTSSDNKINCGLDNTDCSETYTYTVTCDEFGDCTTPTYNVVSLSATTTNGFALANWTGACSGSGSCSVTMDSNKSVAANFFDAQDPTVSLTAPSAGAVISGTTVNLSANASDNNGVGSVSFYFDGSSVGSDTTSPYSMTLNSTTRTEGRHTIGARAIDVVGRQSTLVPRSVIVDNLAPTVLNNATSSPDPGAGEKGVSRTANVSATFSEEMDPGTLTSSSFKLQQYNSKTRKWKTIPATISFTNSNTTAILDPYDATEGGVDKPLGANKKLKVTITTGAQDISNHAMASNFVWKFNTGG